MKQRHFKSPLLSRPKLDPVESGTEVVVERLKGEQRQFLARTANRSRIIRELSRTYSAMLRPNGLPVAFKLFVNGNAVRGRNYCIWGGEGNPNREVITARWGIVSAYQPIDVQLKDRPFCSLCWQWLPFQEIVCPTCSSADSVVSRSRRVRGWLGLQRYLHDSEFGIDFVRNGRKIELANKDLFAWSDGEKNEDEYPIDDPRRRGRIVGEVHLDHCRVTYTKDRFDRNDPGWDEMVRIIRGEGPLRPDKAGELGFGQNTAPLFLLFQAFRRSTPKPKIAGAYAKLLVVPDNGLAEEMAKKFYDGAAEYQPDTKWYELVEEEDRKLLKGGGKTPEGPTNPLIDEITGGPEGGPTQPPHPGPPQPHPPIQRTPIASLSREYISDETSLRWNVAAFQAPASDPLLQDGSPWTIRYSPNGTFEFIVNPRHAVFQSATLTPSDALLCALAAQGMDTLRNSANAKPHSLILTGLRSRYATESTLDPVTLAGEAASTLSSIARSLPRNVQPEDSLAVFQELLSTEREAILARMATVSVPNPQQAINDGRFLQFAPKRTILSVFETNPELFLDGRYWDAPYTGLDYGSQTEYARTQVLRHYAGLLADAIWLAEQDPTDLADLSRARLLRASLALELLSAGVCEPEG